MHVDNELVEFVTAGEQKYEEVTEEYEEETTCINISTHESY